MVNEIDVECTNCGLKEKVIEGRTGAVISHRGIFMHKNKTCQWPGVFMNKNLLTKEIYDKQIKEWKENPQENSHNLKKIEHFEHLWKKDNIEIFKCPECGKETLKWTISKGYET